MVIQFFEGGGLQGQFSRFVKVGVFNTVVTYLAYLALNLAFPYVIAYLFSFILGVMISAWLNARYSFAIHLGGRTLIRFVLVYLISFAMSVQVLVFCIEVIGINATIAPLIVLALFTPINFLSSKLALTGQWRGQN